MSLVQEQVHYHDKINATNPRTTRYIRTTIALIFSVVTLKCAMEPNKDLGMSSYLVPNPVIVPRAVY